MSYFLLIFLYIFIFFSAQFNNNSIKKNCPTHGFNSTHVSWVGLNFFLTHHNGLGQKISLTRPMHTPSLNICKVVRTSCRTSYKPLCDKMVARSHPWSLDSWGRGYECVCFRVSEEEKLFKWCLVRKGRRKKKWWSWVFSPLAHQKIFYLK